MKAKPARKTSAQRNANLVGSGTLVRRARRPKCYYCREFPERGGNRQGAHLCQRCYESPL
jgi:hypothetical protein